LALRIGVSEVLSKADLVSAEDLCPYDGNAGKRAGVTMLRPSSPARTEGKDGQRLAS
jgi:hypothetical protein